MCYTGPMRKEAPIVPLFGIPRPAPPAGNKAHCVLCNNTGWVETTTIERCVCGR